MNSRILTLAILIVMVSVSQAQDQSIGFGEYVNIGNEKYQAGDYQSAYDDYCNAIKLNPKDPDVFINRANALYYMERYSEAINDYTESIRIYPLEATAYNGRGVAYFMLKNYDSAMIDYRKALKLDSTFANAYFNVGNLYYAQNDYPRAVEYFTKAIANNDKYPEAFFNRAVAYLNQDMNIQAKADLETTITLAPTNNQAWYYLGRIAMQGKDYSHAIDIFTDIINSEPANRDAIVSRAECYMMTEQNEKAISDQSIAIESNPNDYYTLYNRGICRLRLERLEGAAADLAIAAKHITEIADLPFNLAYTLYRLSRYQEALTALATISEMDAKSYRLKAHCHINLNQYPQAVEGYSNLLNLEKSAANYYDRGIARVHNNELDNALADFNASVKEDPGFYMSWIESGNVLAKQKKYAQAAVSFEKALKIKDDLEGVHRMLGMSLFNSDNKKKALEAYNQALILSPNDAKAYRGRGLCRLHLTALDEGCDDLMKAKELGDTQAQQFIDRFCD